MFIPSAEGLINHRRIGDGVCKLQPVLPDLVVVVERRVVVHQNLDASDVTVLRRQNERGDALQERPAQICRNSL